MYNSGRRGKRAPDGYGVISVNDKFHQTSYPIPIIDSWSITDGSYNPIDDTALNTAGGQTVVLYGSGFASGATVNINGSNIGIVTVLDSNRITFTSPALSSASYTIYVSNPNGATAIYVPGLVYSGLPTWSSPASGSIGTNYETKDVSTLNYTTFTANGDATITYSIISGNLPSGVTLSSSGELSGTLPATSSPTTYSFTIRASDGQNQDSDRAFSLTINPDAVTWVAPTLNGSLSVYETQAFSTPLSATSAAGYGVMYSADTLPTGITLNPSTGALVGYANTVGNTNAQLTATANTTGRYTTSNVTFTVNQDVVTWSTPANNTQYALDQGVAMSGVTLSATSAAGYGVQYTANALPTGVTLSGGTISGTPTETQTVYTQLTATSNTTNRTATRFISWTVSVSGDQYFKYNTLLLSANNLIQSPSFVYDNSINNSQLSVVGDTRATNFNPYQHGYYSVDLGASTYVRADNNDLFRFRTGDFTIEFWLYCNVNWTEMSNPGVAGQKLNDSSTGWQIYRNGTNNTDKMNIRIFGTNDYHANATPKTGLWEHWAVTRQSGTLRWFKDGILTNTHNSVTGDINDTGGYFFCGFTQTWSGYSNFKLSNMRIVKGTALYTSSFTPSTTPLNNVANTSVLLFNSNKIVDSSPNNLTLTTAGTPIVSAANPFSNVYQAGSQYYSYYFNGASYLSGTLSSSVIIGTNDFCLEGWGYWTSFNDGQYGSPIISLYGATAGELMIRANKTSASTTSANWYNIVGGSTYIPSGMFSSGISGGTLYLNRWHHLAVSRKSGVWSFFIDGVRISTTSTGDASLTLPFTTAYIGSDGSGGSGYMNGQVSNVRLVVGDYVYDGATYTVPTAPLTAITGTKLLTAQDSTFKDNSGYTTYTFTQSSANIRPTTVSPFTPSSYSNTQITTYGSGYFDGAGDYITIPAAPSTVLTGDFTVEAWIYPTVLNTNNMVFGSDNGTNSDYFNINSSSINFAISAHSSPNYPSWNYTFTVNQWYHVVLVRQSNTLSAFVNGIKLTLSSGSASESRQFFQSSVALMIGRYGYVTNPWYFTGYISGARIVKGTALYTSNFVPQFTSALTNVTNTQLLTLQTNGTSNNSTFVDESRFDNKVTRFGNATNGTFSPYGDNWSVYFPGTSGTYLATPTALKTAMGNGFSGNIISMEMFVFPTNLLNGSYINSFVGAYQAVAANGRWNFYHNRSSASTATLGFSYTTGTGSQANLDTTNAVLNSNQWNHIAVTIDATTNTNTTIKIFANGSLVQTWTGQNLSTQTAYYDSPRIGGPNSSFVDQFAGYISNFRILKGAFAYTGSYTVPTGPLQSITGTVFNGLQSNRFVDFSVNNYAITPTGSPAVQDFSPFGTLVVPKYYSTFFNGTTDYLTAPAPITTYQAFDWSGTSWTVEGWYNFNSVTGNKGLFTYPDLLQGWYDGTNLKFEYRHATGPAWATNYTAYTIQPNTWYHIALVLNSGSMRCYVNGTAIGTASTGIGVGARGSTTGFGEKFAIGANDIFTFGSIDSYFSGYISNFRVSKIAVYTGNFTVPTAPLQITQSSNTNISAITTGQVTLLTCKDISLKDNTSNNWTISSNTFTAIPAPLSPFTPTATTISYSPQVFGSSMYFSGTGDYLSAPNTNSFDLSRGAWTIECWFYQLAAKQVQLFSVGTARWRFDVGTNGSAGFLFNTSSVTSYPSGSFPPGQWNHIAATFTNDGTTIQQKSYANGKLVALGQYGPSADTTSVFYVGRNTDAGSSWDFNGYMTDVLITKGESLYGQSSFYPRTSPAQVTANTAFLLNGTTASVVDATRTTNLQTVADARVSNFSPYNGNYYSILFSSSYLYLNNQLALGSGDFTIEFFVYFNDVTTAANIFEGRPLGTNGAYPTIYVSSGTLRFFVNSSDRITSSTVSTGIWYHVAVVRSSGTTKMYVNGTQAGSNYTDSTVYLTGANRPIIGSYDGSSGMFSGYISNFRIIIGTAQYTTNFTPSTTPLTAVTGTSLLTCQSNKFIDNSASGLTLSQGGTPKVSTQNPFQVNTGQSYYFDGTGDYLTSPASPAHTLGSGDFTVECWLYLSTATNAGGIVGTWSGTASSSGWLLSQGYNNTSAIRFGMSDGTNVTFVESPAGALSVGQWMHVAATRTSGTLKLFVNGTQQYSGALSVNSSVNAVLGIAAVTNNTFLTTGYISDLRITKGVARTITVPSTPLILK